MFPPGESPVVGSCLGLVLRRCPPGPRSPFRCPPGVFNPFSGCFSGPVVNPKGPLLCSPPVFPGPGAPRNLFRPQKVKGSRGYDPRATWPEFPGPSPRPPQYLPPMSPPSRDPPGSQLGPNHRDQVTNLPGFLLQQPGVHEARLARAIGPVADDALASARPRDDAGAAGDLAAGPLSPFRPRKPSPVADRLPASSLQLSKALAPVQLAAQLPQVDLSQPSRPSLDPGSRFSQVALQFGPITPISRPRLPSTSPRASSSETQVMNSMGSPGVKET